MRTVAAKSQYQTLPLPNTHESKTNPGVLSMNRSLGSFGNLRLDPNRVEI